MLKVVILYKEEPVKFKPVNFSLLLYSMQSNTEDYSGKPQQYSQTNMDRWDSYLEAA